MSSHVTVTYTHVNVRKLCVEMFQSIIDTHRNNVIEITSHTRRCGANSHGLVVSWTKESIISLLYTTEKEPQLKCGKQEYIRSDFHKPAPPLPS